MKELQTRNGEIVVVFSEVIPGVKKCLAGYIKNTGQVLTWDLSGKFDPERGPTRLDILIPQEPKVA